MPTISYFICPRLAWFSLSVKICMEWFIRLYSWTATAQSVGLVEKKILILNSILSKTLPYSWLLAEGVQTALQAGQDLPHHLFPSAHLSRTGLPAPPSRGHRTTSLPLSAVPFKVFQKAMPSPCSGPTKMVSFLCSMNRRGWSCWLTHLHTCERHFTVNIVSTWVYRKAIHIYLLTYLLTYEELQFHGTL